MSAKKGGFNPAGMVSLDDVERMGNFFKNLLKDSPGIRLSIYAAGVAAVLEILHIIWLAFRFLMGF
ncbi:MAG: hypothetical protein WAL85_15980 [Candidatus Korobacteraceae bacterium]